MPFGLPPTAPKPQLSGVRPHLTPNSAVQKPQALANTARAFSPMLKTARQTLTQLPTPMQALGNLSLEGTGIDGFERLATSGGSKKGAGQPSQGKRAMTKEEYYQKYKERRNIEKKAERFMQSQLFGVHSKTGKRARLTYSESEQKLVNIDYYDRDLNKIGNSVPFNPFPSK